MDLANPSIAQVFPGYAITWRCPIVSWKTFQLNLVGFSPECRDGVSLTFHRLTVSQQKGSLGAKTFLYIETITNLKQTVTHVLFNLSDCDR